MIPLKQKCLQYVFYSNYKAISFILIGVVLFLVMPTGRAHAYEHASPRFEFQKANYLPGDGSEAELSENALLISKAKEILSIQLNAAKPLSVAPAWQRPLPSEPLILPLNIRDLPLPEVTSGTLIIPALDLEEPITRVLVKNGFWDVSNLNAQVGHLQTTGERPGEGLAMTFVGHTTWPAAGPFAYLYSLQHGEEIIYRWNGYDYVYQIDRMVHVLPTQVGTLYEENGDAIMLATCSGWNPESGQYDTRLVTRAVLVEKRLAPPPTRMSLIS